MSTHTRRDFLAHSAATAGLLALGPQLLLAADAAKPAGMAIARWKGQNTPTDAELKDIAVKLTEKAMEGVGGMKRFVGQGDVVWIKANIGWDRNPQQAANTNPDLVATLVKMCFDAGAKKVKIGDFPCDVAAKTYENSGIAAAVRPLGAEVVFLDRNRFRETNLKGERLKKMGVYPEIVNCDLVINVPIAKHHVLAGATLCMKNYMGVVDKRPVFHQDIPTCVADITRYMKPRLCLLDGIRVLLRNGPKGGSLKDVALRTTVAAGVDIVAMDALGAELLGKKPTDIRTIVKGQQVGLGKMDYRSIAREIAVS